SQRYGFSMHRTADSALSRQSRKLCSKKQPLTDGGSEVGRTTRGVEPLDVDPGDQCVDRQLLLLRCAFQPSPKYWLKADRSLVAGNGYRPFRRRSQHHQYICCPPLIDRVEPVTKPAFSSTKKATPRAV